MMIFDIEHNGRKTLSVDAEGAVGLGYPLEVIGAAMKRAALRQVEVLSDTYREKIARASAGKIAEYRIKEEIGRDPQNAAPAELALLTREAVAGGTDLDGLIDHINAQAGAFRQIALLIGALEAEAKAAITAVPDGAADIETQIQTALEAKKAEIETAFAEATALINGGS
jgi:hypothetical protein